MPYSLFFTLQGLPKRTNNQSSHWRGRASEAKKWKAAVFVAVFNKRPPAPLERASLTLIRHSSTEPDFDGLVSGFKHVIDGLIHAHIIINDKKINIGMPVYQWLYEPRNKGYLSIKVNGDE